MKNTPTIAKLTSTRRHASLTQNGARASLPACDKAILDLVRQSEKVNAECAALARDGKDIIEHCQNRGIDLDDLPMTARKLAATQRAEAATVKGELTVSVATYGALCQAAIVHGLPDWRAAAAFLIESVSVDWTNDGFFVPSPFEAKPQS
jgi:hypothetical protein